MFVQLLERSCVEDVRARFGAIKDEQANVIVADLATDHWTCSDCRHQVHIGHFLANSKRKRTGVSE